MTNSEAPYYINFVQTSVNPERKQDLYRLAGQLIDLDPEIYLEDKVAINMLLGQYVVVKGDIEVPGEPILPEELIDFGINLSRKVRNGVIEEANSSVREAVLTGDFIQQTKWEIVGNKERNPSNATGMYLTMAGEYAISADERTSKMIDLSVTVQNGLAAKTRLDEAVSSNEKLGANKAEKLNADIQEGTFAKRDMTLINLLLAPYFAKKFNQGAAPSLTFDDLVQELNIFIMNRTEKWTPSNSTFATFVGSFAVHYLIAVGDDTGHMVRIPRHKAAELRSVKRCIAGREVELGRMLTMKETQAIEKDYAKTAGSHRSLQKAQNARNVRSMLPLESMTPAIEELSDVDNDTARRRAKRTPIQLADESMTEIVYDQSELAERLDTMLTMLNVRQAGIIRMRYGLTEDGQPKTLPEIAEIYGVTSERIRQIEASAMKKLHQFSTQAKLDAYLTS